jgi:hypothetical protein
MSLSLTELKSLARSHTETAINTLVGVMRQEEAPHAARVAAANSILDRGWGKPAQSHTGEGGEGPVLASIKVEFVRPSDGSGG